jgi:hypothetical protein
MRTKKWRRHFTLTEVNKGGGLPSAPGLSLAGVRLIIPDHDWGFPCCARFPCIHAAASTPAQRLGVFLARHVLLGVHSRCGLHTRAVTVFRDRYPGASDILSPPCLPRLLPTGAIAGSALHPLESAALSRRVESGHSHQIST